MTRTTVTLFVAFPTKEATRKFVESGGKATGLYPTNLQHVRHNSVATVAEVDAYVQPDHDRSDISREYIIKQTMKGLRLLCHASAVALTEQELFS